MSEVRSAAERGHRGYIASRPIGDRRVPQRVQNLVVRDHARSRNLRFLLSATEYAMSHCYMMLAQLTEELPRLDGIILYSMFMLPERAERRIALYESVLAANATLRAALEDLVLAGPADVARWEDIFSVHIVTNRSRGGPESWP